MKKLFFLILLYPWMVLAGLDEVPLLTLKKDCQLNYLTTLARENWSFQLDEGECSNGLIQGFARVSLYNPQGKLSEKLQGFFVAGYWLGGFAGFGPFVARTTPEENQQALSFILSQEADISYVVQLRSPKNENNSYGPFMGCPDFRLMVVVDQPDLFQKISFQEKIALKTLELAHRYCQNLDQIALFGALKMKANTSDIIFQMDIDPETEERKVVFQNLPPTELEVNIPVKKQKSAFLKSEVLKMTPLAHLDILSRLSNTPQQGRVMVHINQLNLDGTAWVDLPEKIKLKNNSQLKTGWMIVQGKYFQKEMSVEMVQSCQKEWCSDVQ